MSRTTAVLAVTAVIVAMAACKGSKTEATSSGPTSTAPAKPPAGLPGQSQSDLAENVATIDGTPITVAEFQDRINKQSPYVRARYTSLEQKKEFLDTLVRFEVLAAEAKKRGYDKDPEVVRTMKQVMIQRLLKEEFESRVKPEDIADEEMKKFYDAHLTDYNKPEEVRVSAIIVKDKAKAQKVEKEAKLPANADNKQFRDLVTKYSEDEDSKARGGDLRFFSAEAKNLPPDVVKASFELKNQGDVSAPVATQNGYYVLKQTGSRKAISKSFDDVKRQIQNRLYRDKRQQAMQEFEAGLKKQAKVEIHQDALAKVQVDTSQPASPEAGEPGMPVPPPGGPTPVGPTTTGFAPGKPASPAAVQGAMQGGVPPAPAAVKATEPAPANPQGK